MSGFVDQNRYIPARELPYAHVFGFSIPDELQPDPDAHSYEDKPTDVAELIDNLSQQISLLGHDNSEKLELELERLSDYTDKAISRFEERNYNITTVKFEELHLKINKLSARLNYLLFICIVMVLAVFFK